MATATPPMASNDQPYSARLGRSPNNGPARPSSTTGWRAPITTALAALVRRMAATKKTRFTAKTSPPHRACRSSERLGRSPEAIEMRP